MKIMGVEAFKNWVNGAEWKHEQHIHEVKTEFSEEDQDYHCLGLAYKVSRNGQWWIIYTECFQYALGKLEDGLKILEKNERFCEHKTWTSCDIDVHEHERLIHLDALAIHLPKAFSSIDYGKAYDAKSVLPFMKGRAGGRIDGLQASA